MSTASAASTDLSTIGRTRSLACLTAQLVINSELQAPGTGLKGSAKLLDRAALRRGEGGLRIQFVEFRRQLAQLKEKLIEDEYFFMCGPGGDLVVLHQPRPGVQPGLGVLEHREGDGAGEGGREGLAPAAGAPSPRQFHL